MPIDHAISDTSSCVKKDPLLLSGSSFDLIAYTEQPCVAATPGSPFGEHSACTLFLMFTANIIEARVPFSR